MQGPLLALGGDLGGDGVRMQWGEVLTLTPGSREKPLPKGKAGWQLGWPRAGRCARA